MAIETIRDAIADVRQVHYRKFVGDFLGRDLALFVRPLIDAPSPSPVYGRRRAKELVLDANRVLGHL